MLVHYLIISAENFSFHFFNKQKTLQVKGGFEGILLFIRSMNTYWMLGPSFCQKILRGQSLIQQWLLFTTSFSLYYTSIPGNNMIIWASMLWFRVQPLPIKRSEIECVGLFLFIREESRTFLEWAKSTGISLGNKLLLWIELSRHSQSVWPCVHRRLKVFIIKK